MSARDEIACRLWLAVPSDDDAEAKAKTEQMLDAYRAEVLAEAKAAVESPQKRAEVGGGLGWETARDVLHRMIQKAGGRS